MPSMRFTSSAMFLLLCFYMTLLSVLAAESVDEDYTQETKRQRRKAKPWYLEEWRVLGIPIPFAPITLGTVLMGLIHVAMNWESYCWVECSHILSGSKSDEAFDKMKQWKKEIGNDATKFGEYAEKYSNCASSKKKGSLGRIYNLEQAPAFDEVCFNKDTPVETTIGPFVSHFGFHLLYIHKRRM